MTGWSGGIVAKKICRMWDKKLKSISFLSFAQLRTLSQSMKGQIKDNVDKRGCVLKLTKALLQ
jgi:hypothetical protein